MNLQNLNVAELSAQEVRETEGGFLGVIGAVAAVIGVIYAYEQCVGALYEAGHNIGSNVTEAFLK